MAEIVRLFCPDNPDEVTVRKIIKMRIAFLAQRVAAGTYSAHTFDNAERALQSFLALFGEQSVSECRRHDLTEWLTLNPQWRKNNSKRNHLTIVLACFRWAEDEELIDRNPYRWPRGLRLPIERRRPAEQNEYVRLMRCPSRPLRRALFFLRRVGRRPIEMRELRFDEIDWEAAVVVKEKHKTRHATGRPTMFGIKPVLRFLRNLYRQRKPGQVYVFTNAYGQPWKDRHVFARHLRRWAKRIGLDECAGDRVSSYCVRHSYVTWAVEAGHSERQIADQVGHADTRMISHYSHAAKKRKYLSDVSDKLRRRKKD